MAETGAKCNGCGARPLVADLSNMKFPNGLIVSVVHCHDCGYTLSTFPSGFEPQIVEAPKVPEAGPRLVS